MPSRVVQSPPYTTGVRPSDNAARTRVSTASVMATSAASLTRLVAAPRLGPACGDVEVAAVVDVVPGECLGDACLAQYR